jgi:pantoate--beta-alanine ligase
MGALHEGHLALARRARAENDLFVASVFVNPAQFGPGEDYATYARPFAHDCELLQEVGCDVLFAPGPEAMYPSGLPSTPHVTGTAHADHPPQTFVEVSRLGEVWEGTVRPGHLRGVATIVTMLFNITRPHRAYFGEKDYQQLKVIQHLVRDLFLGVEVVPCVTVREPDGLALSSRNANLSQEERAAAVALSRALQVGVEWAQKGRARCSASGREDVRSMQRRSSGETAIHRHCRCRNARCSFKPLTDAPLEYSLQARVGSTRLIDNMPIR